ncbi:MAG: MBL fold metallo-hydrolase [archaeon]
MRITPVISNSLSSNAYVISGERCVIDPGLGSVDYGISTDEVNVVLLTHNHYDHSANAGKFPNATVYVHEKDLPSLASGEGIYAEFCGKKPEPVQARPLPKKICGLKVIHTPGHTPGSVCFLDKKEKALLSGDTVFADGVGRTDLAGGNERELLKSLRKISSLPFEHLLPGHGSIGNKKSAIEGLHFLNMLDNRR